jgi:hypothetical protein
LTVTLAPPEHGSHPLSDQLEHDPEKWELAFPRDKRESVCAEIMLKQRDKIMIRFNLIGS